MPRQVPQEVEEVERDKGVTFQMPTPFYERAQALIGMVDDEEDPWPHRRNSVSAILRIAVQRGLEELEYLVEHGEED